MSFPGKRAILTVFSLFFILGARGFAETGDPDTADFVLVKENNGIAIYERWLPIRPNQMAREIKATFQVRALPGEAVALIKNESKGREWNKNTLEYRIIPENESNWVGYIQYDLPWPVSNQDCVLKYIQNSLGKSLLIEFHEARHPSFPVQKRIQRIPGISGRWIFTETELGISVEYYISTTPSTTLPGWITDPIIRNNLLDTLEVFRTILEGDSD